MPPTCVWTIPIRCDLKTAMVLPRSKADISPARILWIVLWIAQYVPVLPIPALKSEISQTNNHIIYYHYCLYEYNWRANLQCTTIGPKFGGKWYNLFKISRTAYVSLGTPWSGHSGYWMCKTDKGGSSSCK